MTAVSCVTFWSRVATKNIICMNDFVAQIVKFPGYSTFFFNIRYFTVWIIDLIDYVRAIRLYIDMFY